MASVCPKCNTELDVFGDEWFCYECYNSLSLTDYGSCSKYSSGSSGSSVESPSSPHSPPSTSPQAPQSKEPATEVHLSRFYVKLHTVCAEFNLGRTSEKDGVALLAKLFQKGYLADKYSEDDILPYIRAVLEKIGSKYNDAKWKQHFEAMGKELYSNAVNELNLLE